MGKKMEGLEGYLIVSVLAIMEREEPKIASKQRNVWSNTKIHVSL